MRESGLMTIPPWVMPSVTLLVTIIIKVFIKGIDIFRFQQDQP
jgi:hypothetical protein